MELLQGLRNYWARLQEETQQGDRAEKQRQIIYEEKLKLNTLLSRVRFFPGSVEEYQRTVGYEVEVVDTGCRDMGVTFKEELFIDPNGVLSRLVENGVEALVNCFPFQTQHGQYTSDIKYGLPVKRAEGKKATETTQ